MRRFAEGTDVSPERSRAEIEAVLRRYGATEFASGWAPDRATIMFAHGQWRVRFFLPIPKIEAFNPAKGNEPKGWNSWTPERRKTFVQRARDAEERRRWRALALVIKAKLEAIASKITTFEDEFLAHIMIPGGITVGEKIASQLIDSYKTGGTPPLLGTGAP